MSSKVPFIKKEIVWLSIVPRLLFIGILCLAFYPLDKKYFFQVAFIGFLIVTFGLRRVAFPADIRTSITLIREAKFEEAIPFIKRSIEFYSKHPWIDKYRFLLMISSSKLGIMEMSLCNLAYCHLQIGEVKVARQMYEDVLRQYPENPIAKVQLATINIVASNSIVE